METADNATAAWVRTRNPRENPRKESKNVAKRQHRADPQQGKMVRGPARRQSKSRSSYKERTAKQDQPKRRGKRARWPGKAGEKGRQVSTWDEGPDPARGQVSRQPAEEWRGKLAERGRQAVNRQKSRKAGAGAKPPAPTNTSGRENGESSFTDEECGGPQQ